MRLLIVDDDAVFRDELADLLRDEGHTVSTAPSVPKAIEVLESEDFDVVLSDLKMPRQSGLDLLREVHARWPRTLSVMITGFATVESAVNAMKLGAFDYVRKPFQLTQVQQVLKLAEQELQFREGTTKGPDTEGLVRNWVRRDGFEVLLITPRTVRKAEKVTAVPLDVESPFRLRESVDAFLAQHEKAAVLIEGADLLLKGRRRADVVALLAGVRERMAGKGPFVVSFDPKNANQADVADLRAAVVAPTTHGTLETLSNPIRRAILRRAAQGACSFTQAMEAAGLDDSPKLSFHLRKLVEDGLVVHSEERYRITPRGQEAVKVLLDMDAISSPGLMGSAVVPAPTK